MLKNLVIAVLSLTLLSVAMARSFNGTKEERITQTFTINGNSHGSQISLNQWFHNIPWNFFLSSRVSPPERTTVGPLTTTTTRAPVK
ncbi:unnamed protein product [Allacma fusca]|uniref:Secreted protein n=1 Tax=Allacma fusca TaxID=39272 RepID=A0A8J2JL52_9HEXA|nr:unnamed protein product [Allacma fusca]